MAGYYYRQLDREKRGVYDAMLAGMEALAPGIRVPRLDGPELSDIYLRLKLDTPLLFYVTGFQYRWMPGADHVELLPEYLFDKGKIRQHRQAVAARLDRLARPLQGKSDRDKELSIHAFILENVRYDKLKKPYSHEIIGPLTQGVGVCEGIAKTVKALCDAVQLPCIVALSEAAPERGVKYRHTWNVITVDGQRYHLDATFDNSLQRGTPRYDYFNLCARQGCRTKWQTPRHCAAADGRNTSQTRCTAAAARLGDTGGRYYNHGWSTPEDRVSFDPS